MERESITVERIEIEPAEELVERVEFMTDLGDECAEIMQAGFGADRDQVGSHNKPDGSIVTDVDEAIQRHANRRCTEHGDVTVGEEGSTGTHDQDAWHIDPLDGTRDFDDRRGRRKTSVAAFSSGWVTTGEDGQVSRVGVIELPLLAQPATLQAVENGGAFITQGGNTHRLQIDTRPATGVVMVTSRDNEESRQYVDAIVEAGFMPVRVHGAVFKSSIFAAPELAKEHLEEYSDSLSAQEKEALQAVIDGTLTIVGNVSTKSYAHDHAAAGRIVAEAGGLVCAPDGGPLSFEPGSQGSVFANNHEVQQTLVGILQAARG